jgi:hypothetical protein
MFFTQLITDKENKRMKKIIWVQNDKNHKRKFRYFFLYIVMEIIFGSCFFVNNIFKRKYYIFGLCTSEIRVKLIYLVLVFGWIYEWIHFLLLSLFSMLLNDSFLEFLPSNKTIKFLCQHLIWQSFLQYNGFNDF